MLNVLPTPAAITAGPLVFRLAFFESVFVQAGFFWKVHIVFVLCIWLSWTSLGCLGLKKVANMVPTWLSKREHRRLGMVLGALGRS